jgi:monoamine oxidase
MRRSVTRQILDDRRLLGGTYQLCEALSRELGSAVRLSSPVTAISQDEAGVQVTSPSGVYHSRAVIVATAVGCVTQIAYTPQLPAELRALWAHGVLGPVIKCVIIYKDAFWRAANLSGMAFSELGPLISCCDASPENGSEAALVGFIRGSQAHLWAPQAQSERRAAVLAQLTRLFGAAASRPIEYFDQCWPAADFPGGSYCVHLPPGVLSRNGQALRQPVGRIHWAGTETETNWNGGMEGAIRAGERAAAEVYARHIA